MLLKKQVRRKSKHQIRITLYNEKMFKTESSQSVQEARRSTVVHHVSFTFTTSTLKKYMISFCGQVSNNKHAMSDFQNKACKQRF